VIGLAVAPAIGLLAYAILYSRWSIPGGSMMPTAQIGDIMLASRFSYVDLGPSVRSAARAVGLDWFRAGPERGDLVIFKYPGPNLDYRGMHYIKRVIGLPGDRVQVLKGVLQINGNPVQRRVLEAPARNSGRFSSGRYRETLPSGRSYEILEISDDQALDNTPVYTVPAGHYFVLGDNRDNSQDSRSEGTWFVPHGNLVARVDRVLWSFEGGASWLPWEWPATFRLERFLKAVQ
jgi:signal peptidase I